MYAKITPFKNEITRLIDMITKFTLIVGIIFFIIGFIIGYDFMTNLVFLIGFIAASVPEGLLLSIHMISIVSAKRMWTKHALVKNVEATDTLGATSCICLNKAMLTQNKMLVSHIFINS
mmetsp:Transcript_19714/g.27290  ORF Transcript_19714/g.27290 Transcript_19714/m.27290 type:complete len:119 (+) Transcript_19714:157-513(+)